MIEPSKPKFRLKDLFVFEGFKFSESFIDGQNVLVELRRTRETGTCPNCNKRCRTIKDRLDRKVRDLDILNAKCYVKFSQFRISCKCGYKGMEGLNFIEPYSRHTKRFEERVVLLCKVMTIKDVANETGLHWVAVKNIDKKEAAKYIQSLSKSSPKKIGVDEIAYEKGHKYLTVVRDADLEKVIWVGKDRKKETLDKFFTELGKEKSSQISIAVMDMWDPFIASVKENTNADIVFDKFHVAKHINQAIDDVRKQEFAKADPEERKLMKKKRFLILSRKKNLKRDKKESLKDLMSKNKKLYKAYLLKEQILDIMDEQDEKKALKRFNRWINNVSLSQLAHFERVVNMLKKYSYGIFNYFKHKLTNAGSEGINTKINVIKRRAYGFRDLEYFMYKIIQLCGVYSPKNV